MEMKVKETSAFPVSETINKNTAGIRVDRAETGAKRIEGSDDEDRGTERLKILRQKANPEFFARADQNNGRKQQNQIAFQSQKFRALANNRPSEKTLATESFSGGFHSR